MKKPYITPQIKIMSNTSPSTFRQSFYAPLCMAEMGERFKQAEETIRQAMQKQSDQLNRQLETICHNYLDPPIKGEITKGKLRWRGVKGIVQQSQATPNGFSLVFLGIIQRDTHITPTGEKVPYKPNTQDITQTL
jgi:hypothetical protein